LSFSPSANPAASEASECWLSPRSFWPVCTSPLTPSKFVSRMKFTTPATASVPYVAVEPLVTVSMLRIIFSGKRFMSGPP
jgi:hypothetical protein